MARPPVSVCIITRNEEKRLPRCLASVEWADEIVVVDSHSTDRTREIAEAAGARVIERDFAGYIDQKRYALSQASHEWILNVDADEVVSRELEAAILDALENVGDRDGFKFSRLTQCFGKWIRRGGWYPDTKLRLFRRSRATWGGREPHDRVEVDGKVEQLSGDLLHYSYEDLGAQVRQSIRFADLFAERMMQEGRKPWLHNLVFRPVVKFLKGYFLQRGFLDGRAGFVLAIAGAYYVFLKQARFWEMHRTSRRGSGAPNQAGT